jgi:NTE family protein
MSPDAHRRFTTSHSVRQNPDLSACSKNDATRVALHMKTKRQRLPGQIVLVLQGGGALGAYQAGVFEALSNAGIEPDWVIGTSIGAINGALIAGNAPSNRLPRLRDFWQRLEKAPASGRWAALFQGIPSFFHPRPAAWAGPLAPVGLDEAIIPGAVL